MGEYNDPLTNVHKNETLYRIFNAKGQGMGIQVHVYNLNYTALENLSM